LLTGAADRRARVEPPPRALKILLINPNTSRRTTLQMAEAAARELPRGVTLRGVTATQGVPMIVTEQDLFSAAIEVVRLGRAAAPEVDAIIIAAFGDPGAGTLRDAVRVPVIGIGEASMREAAADGRRFGVATTTPALAGAIETQIERLGLGPWFTGVRVPNADPLVLAADAARQEMELARAAAACFEQDGAQAVIIGGGPLSATARTLRDRFGSRIVEPVPAAMRRALTLLGKT
jgi:Asp/Glu/hydantoin racemase